MYVTRSVNVASEHDQKTGQEQEEGSAGQLGGKGEENRKETKCGGREEEEEEIGLWKGLWNR